MKIGLQLSDNKLKMLALPSYLKSSPTSTKDLRRSRRQRKRWSSIQWGNLSNTSLISSKNKTQVSFLFWQLMDLRVWASTSESTVKMKKFISLLSIYPLNRKNSLEKTMNANFLKKVFSIYRFYRDYKKFLSKIYVIKKLFRLSF